MKDTDDETVTPVPEFISCLRDHPSWVFTDSQPLEQAVKRGNGEPIAELRFNHTETTGALIINLSDDPDINTIGHGVLQQALDHRQRSNPETDPFLRQLVTAQTSIAEAYDREEITVLSDPVSILRIDFPIDCDRKTIDRVLTDVACASKELASLHQEIMALLDEYSA